MPISYALVVFELAVLVLSLSIHDCAQAWMANRLGDPTGRMMGRISMNPALHFDPLGTILFPLIYAILRPPFVLGWSKPVPMTSRNFRRPRRDENLALLAGPAAQFLLAAVALLVLVVMRHVNPALTDSLGIAQALAMHNLSVGTDGLPGIFPLVLFLYFCILVNLLLFVFNLVPFPYFDGGKILMNYLPYEMAKSYERFGMLFMFLFFFIGFGIVMIFFAPFFNLFNHLLFTFNDEGTHDASRSANPLVSRRHLSRRDAPPRRQHPRRRAGRQRRRWPPRHRRSPQPGQVPAPPRADYPRQPHPRDWHPRRLQHHLARSRSAARRPAHLARVRTQTRHRRPLQPRPRRPLRHR